MAIKWGLAIAGAGLLLVGGCGGKKDMPVVGFYQQTSNRTLDDARDGYIQGLAEGGFKDGETIRLIRKNAEADVATGQLICQDFVGQGVDLIATASTPALQTAMKSTKEIPVVFSAVADPFITGAGETAEKHKANVTGVYTPLPADKVLELAHQLLPNARKFGTLYDPGDAFTPVFQKLIREKARELQVEVVEVAATASNEIIPGIQALKARGADAVVQIPGVNIYTGIESIIRESKKLGMPVFSPEPTHTEYGAVLALGIDFKQAGFEAGQIAARVLKGEKPESIPFSTGKKELFHINQKAAGEFKITIPDEMLKRADRVEK